VELLIMRTPLPTRTVLLLLCGAGMLLAGCQATHMAPQGLVPTDSSAALVMHIANEPYITAEPAYRAAYSLAHGDSFEGDYAALTQTLEADKIVCTHWQYAADRCLNRGDVGFLVCRAVGIRTGVNWNLTGLGRYAYRELIYHNIAEPGSEYRLMTGGEFVGILSRAEQYRRERDRDGMELGPPPM
jgi:hypothetical protein